MPKPTIIITEPIADAPRLWLEERARVIEASPDDPSTFLPALAQADALLVRTYTIVDESLLDAAPNLRVVARAGVGLDNIDLDACQARSIAVVHTPCANTHAVVEYVISMMLQTLRPIHPLTAPITDWHQLRQDAIAPRSCASSTLGIIGLGQIGTALARVASALHLDILANDLEPITPPPDLSIRSTSLPDLASSSDIISIHVDGRPSNHHFFSTDFFAALKPDAILINTSRGFVIDNAAAAKFARANPRATLILDVHTPEPIDTSDPLYHLPNIIATPHIAAATADAKEAMSWVVRDLLAALSPQ
ncbi:MAG: NAD(P)-dependent oxidoreductase [Phycisphaerales bacterium]